MKNRLIYLASPYSHDDPKVRHERFVHACRAAGKLMSEGKIVFSPISHTHPIAQYCDLPKDWMFWERQDRAIIEWCGAMVVLRLPGWQESKGVQAELAIADEYGLPVSYIDPEPLPDCAGCTDPHSEGTHTEGTRQHP